MRFSKGVIGFEYPFTLPFTQIFIINHKGTIFSQNKNSVSECIFIFRYKNVASKSFYQNKIHPFPLMLMQRNEMWHCSSLWTATKKPCKLVNIVKYCSYYINTSTCHYEVTHCRLV